MTYLGPGGLAANPALTYRRPRPATVRLAAIALYAVAFLGLVSAVLSFLEAGPAGDRVTTGSDDANAVTIGLVFYGVVALVAGAYFVVAGIFAMRGNRGMRIATWSVAGLTALCLGCNGFGNGFLASGIDSSALQDSRSSSPVIDAQSHGYMVSTAVVEVLSTLVVIVAIILLAVPASNAYFRKLDPVASGMYPPGYPAATYGYAYPPPNYGYAPPAPAYPQWQSVPPPQSLPPQTLPPQSMPTPGQPAPGVPTPEPAQPHLPPTNPARNHPDEPSDSTV